MLLGIVKFPVLSRKPTCAEYQLFLLKLLSNSKRYEDRYPSHFPVNG